MLRDVSGRRHARSVDRSAARGPADEALQVVHRELGVVDAEEQREVAHARRRRSTGGTDHTLTDAD